MVSIGEELGANHVLYGFFGVFYLSVDLIGIATSGLENDFIFNAELHEFYLLVKFTTFFNLEDGS